MAKLLGKLSDFVIKIIMMFTTLYALLYFAGKVPEFSFTFGFLAVLFIISLMVKGLVDIFSKE